MDTVNSLARTDEADSAVHAASQARAGSLLAAIGQISSGAYFRLDAAGRVLEVDAAWIAMTGMGIAKAREIGWLGIVDSRDVGRVQREWSDALFARGEARLMFRLNAGRLVSVQIVPFRSDDGSDHFLGQLRGVYDGPRHAALAQAPAQTESTMRSTIYAVHLAADGTRTFTYAAPGFADLMGCTPEELAASGQSMFRFVPREYVQRIAQEADASARQSRPFHVEFPVDHPVRGKRIVSCHSVPVPVADGGHEWRGAAIDVTDLRHMEAELRHQTHLNEVAFDQSMACFVLLDRDCRFVRVNRAFANAWERPIDEFAGRFARELFPGSPEAFAAWRIFFDEVVRTGKPMRKETRPLRFVGRNPERILYWDWILQPLLDTQGEVEYVFFLAVDVSDRERDFRVLAENIPDLIVRWDRELRRRYVNPAFARAVGRSEEELIGSRYGTQYLAEHEAANLEPGAKLQEAIRGVIASERAAELELPWFGETGRLDIHLRLVPEFDAKGGLAHVLGIGRDITSLKTTERQLRELNVDLERRIQERTVLLEAANKELETFAYLVSHDLKAPLRGIDAYSRLLQEGHEQGLDDEARLFVRNIRQGASHMATLIDDLLAYTRIERLRLTASGVALAELVREVLDEHFEEIQGRGIVVDVEVGAIVMNADRQGLQVVLRNVVSNAIKFTSRIASPRVEIGAREEEDRVICWVRDNGIGFDMRFHDRIYELFQRLERAEDYSGTGVGLALVRKAMMRMGGMVWAQGTPGAGACFYLALPKAAA
jgi:PAS domain S-box-containing protein